jgi:hypothetical protein
VPGLPATSLRMPAKGRLRVGVIGSGSRIPRLPISWCRGNEVEPGSEVDVYYGDVLVVVPPGARVNRVAAILKELC